MLSKHMIIKKIQMYNNYLVKYTSYNGFNAVINKRMFYFKFIMPT